MGITEPGLYPDLSMADYIADPCPEPALSKGVIKTIVERSPLHAHHEHPRLGGHGWAGSAEANLGSVAHAALFGGEERIAWIDAKDFRTKLAREERDAATDAGQIPMLEKDRQRVDDMIGVSRGVVDSFGEGRTELTMIDQHENGVWLKCRADFVPDDGPVVEYKTTKSAEPLGWCKSILYSMGYHLQAGLYLRHFDDVVFVVQETEPPFDVSIVGLTAEARELAARSIDRASQIWRRCIDEQRWPGYGASTVYSSPPTFVQWDFEQREDLR